MSKPKIHLGTITILIKERVTQAKSVNQILTERGKIIIARLGINLDRTKTTDCTGMITIAVEGTADEINDLNKELDELYGIVAKRAIMTD
jgi:metal-responsive CopG/Arc/MetJ family transcriptional regulator